MSSMKWRHMRPTIRCPYCQRRGAVQRRMGVKSFVKHYCPGPFVLVNGEKADDLLRADFRVTFYPIPPDDPLQADFRVALGDDYVAGEI